MPDHSTATLAARGLSAAAATKRPSANDELKLPAPSEHPARDVVVFDGHCVFCRAQVKRLARLDWFGRLTFLSLHEAEVAEICPNLTHEQLMEQLYVITRDGRQFGGAVAGRYLSRVLPSLWWLAPLLHLPGTLPCWNWCYQRIAAARYKISGSTEQCAGTCKVHWGPRGREAPPHSPET